MVRLCVNKDGDDYFIVQFPFIENEYHYDILLSFGDKCECLEPPHIRAEIKRRLQNATKLYCKEQDIAQIWILQTNSTVVWKNFCKNVIQNNK